MSVSRVVVIFTPVFVALSGYVATQAARLPGAPKLNTGDLTALFIAGSIAAAGAVVTWLNNRGKHERQAAELERSAAEIERWSAEEAGSELEVSELGELLLSNPEEAQALLRRWLGLTAIEADAARAIASASAMDVRLERLESSESAAGVVAAARAT